MGWNDHVSFVQMQCETCGAIDEWECWNNTAKARYSGALGRMLGHDVNNSDRCPHCGSTEGEPVENEDDCDWDLD